MGNHISYPQDSETRKIASIGRQIVHATFDANNWEYHEKTGGDYGVDAELEYSHNNEFRNEKFECQIKATRKLKRNTKGNIVFNQFPVKTLNYALSSALVFIFLLVDVTTKSVYYLKLDHSVIPQKEYNKQKTITLYIPQNNKLPDQEQKIISYITKTTNSEEK